MSNELLKSLMHDLAELDKDGIATLSYDRDAPVEKRWRAWIESKDDLSEVERDGEEPEIALTRVKLVLEGKE